MKSFSILFTESVKEVEDLNEQIQLLDEMPGANMDTRAVHKHLKKQGWSLTRSSGGHDVFTHPEAKHHIPVPRHRQLKAPLVRGILKQSQVNEDVNKTSEKQQHTHVTTQDMEFSGHGKPHIVKKGSHMRYVEGSRQMYVHLKNGKPVEKTHPILSIPHEFLKSVNEEIVQEGRPSQRHPLEGHEYHKKTDAELEYIAKDAHKAAEAMKSHNTDAENKYRDQANDSATVRYYRKKNGMQPWYKKKYGHVNEEVVEEGAKSPGVGWMLKADPKLGAKVDANKRKFKAFKKTVGNKDAGKSEKVIKEDDVINTNSQNSLDGVEAPKQPTKKKQVIDRYTTGTSSAPSSTTVVASPRESVEIQEAYDVKGFAKKLARKNGGLKEENNDNTLSSYDKDDTPAKKTLSKTAGMVKDLAKNAKEKAKTKTSNDKFQPEPELSSNIVR